MNDFIQKYASVWNDDPLFLMKEYEYLPQKTKELDAVCKDNFNREKLYEIILWKLNRLPEIPDEMIERLKAVFNFKRGEHRKASDILPELLSIKGIALPMASTILRFANPNTFQMVVKTIRSCKSLSEESAQELPFRL